MKTSVCVRVYDYKALLRLIIRDLRRAGLVSEYQTHIHYVGGLDKAGHPSIRVDLTPIDTPRGSQQH